jgi:hypothetical protein
MPSTWCTLSPTPSSPWRSSCKHARCSSACNHRWNSFATSSVSANHTRCRRARALSPRPSQWADATSGFVHGGARSSSLSLSGTCGRAGSCSGCMWRSTTTHPAFAFPSARSRSPLRGRTRRIWGPDGIQS